MKIRTLGEDAEWRISTIGEYGKYISGCFYKNLSPNALIEKLAH